MLKLRTVLLLSAFLLPACSSAWVVRSGPDGGTVGYKDSADGLADWKEHTKELVSCPDTFKIMRDSVRFEEYDTHVVTSPSEYSDIYTYDWQATSNEPIGGNKGAWHEVTYRCPTTDTRAVASEPQK